MKFRFSSLIAILALLNILSCMQDYPNPNDVQKEIKVDGSIDGATNSGVKTRALNNKWEKNDAIGIFMKKSGANLAQSALAPNAKYVTTDGSSNFSPVPSNEIYFPLNEEKVDFISYYPYSEKLDDFNYPVDVTDQSKLAKIDLMYAGNVKGIDSSTENVNLSFKHQLSNLVLNITMEEGGSDLSELKAEITNAHSKASFSLIDGTLNNLSDPSNISFNVSTDGTLAQVILLPTTSLLDQKLVLTLGTSIYSYDLSENATIKTFDKSTKYTLEVTLEEEEEKVSLKGISATIEDWITGPSETIIANKESSNDETSPEEDNNESDSAKGDGTEANPFTVDKAQGKVGENTKWVKGYIVGSYGFSFHKKNFINGIKDPGSVNIAIASARTETDFTKTFLIDYRNNSNGDVVSRINLKNDPTLFLKEVYLSGNIQLDNNGDIMLKNVRKAILNGEKIGDK